eukprot:Awhi_evm1s10631
MLFSNNQKGKKCIRSTSLFNKLTFVSEKQNPYIDNHSFDYGQNLNNNNSSPTVPSGDYSDHDNSTTCLKDRYVSSSSHDDDNLGCASICIEYDDNNNLELKNLREDDYLISYPCFFQIIYDEKREEELKSQPFMRAVANAERRSDLKKLKDLNTSKKATPLKTNSLFIMTKNKEVCIIPLKKATKKPKNNKTFYSTGDHDSLQPTSLKNFCFRKEENFMKKPTTKSSNSGNHHYSKSQCYNVRYLMYRGNFLDDNQKRIEFIFIKH